jgi:hypothetical protein
MKHSLHKSWYIVGVMTFAFASGLVAQPTTTVNLLSYPEGVQGPVMGDVYTSPYYATIGTSSSVVPIICDDFADESYLPESWTAYETSLSGVTTGPVKWTGGGTVPGGVGSISEAAAYTTAAYLAVEILETNQSTPAGAEQAGDLSYAMWALFDSAVFTDQTNGAGGTCTLSGGYGCLSSTDFANAEADLESAYASVKTNGLNTANFDSKEGVNVTIYTYDTGAACSGTSCSGPPQEFISVTTPEASTPMLLAADLLGFMALVGFFRKRMPKNV